MSHSSMREGNAEKLTVLALEEREELRGEVVSELTEGVGELATIDRPRTITVKVAEDALPVLRLCQALGLSM